MAYKELSKGFKEIFDGLVAFHTTGGLAQIYEEKSEKGLSAEQSSVRIHDERAETAICLHCVYEKKW